MDVTLVKTQAGLVPSDPESRAWFDKIGLGSVVSGKFSLSRNPKFHRKFFALMNLGFDNWEPQEVETPKHGKFIPEKSFDEFRRWVIVRAGYYDVIGYPDGSVRLRAKSIKFSKMDDDKFSSLYSNVINVLLGDVLTSPGWDEAEVDRVVDQLIMF